MNETNEMAAKVNKGDSKVEIFKLSEGFGVLEQLFLKVLC